MGDGIDTILKTYETTEKQLLAGEKAAQQKAEQYRGPQPGRITAAGVAGQGGNGSYAGGYADDGLGRGYRDPYASPQGYPQPKEATKQEPKKDDLLSGAPGKAKSGDAKGIKSPIGKGKKKASAQDQEAKKKDEASKKAITPAEQDKLVNEIYAELQKASQSVTVARDVLPNNNAGFADHINNAQVALANEPGGADYNAFEQINEAAVRVMQANAACTQLETPAKQALKKKLASANIATTLGNIKTDSAQVQSADTPKYRWYMAGGCQETGQVFQQNMQALGGNPQTLEQARNNIEQAIARNNGLDSAEQLPAQQRQVLGEMLNKAANKQLTEADMRQIDATLKIRCKLSDLAAAIDQLDTCLGKGVFIGAQQPVAPGAMAAQGQAAPIPPGQAVPVGGGPEPALD